MFASLIFVFIVPSLTFATVDAENVTYSPRDQDADYCLLPPYPEHGTYTVSNYPSAKPGERYSSVKLDIFCDTGYLINNAVKSILCINTYWSETMPTCVRDLLGFCTLATDDLKLEYRCASAPGSLTSSHECVSFVPSGTVVTPICRSPGYFSLRVLPEMHCRDGMWDYNPVCRPACGLTTQHRQLEGTSSNHLQLPWHAVIYDTGSEPYKQKCGGSLISASKIISAAQHFYDSNDGLQPASNFVVAVNKLYRAYNDLRDINSQHSDVVDIIIPSSYAGHVTSYEDDIAITVVKTPFFFHLSVRPVCLDFDDNLDSTQLIEGNSGKTVRWTFAGDNDQQSELLNEVDFPYKSNEDCNNILWTGHKHYLTKDKFCAVYNSDTWPSTRNIGGGLAFLESNTQRYYLRGVLSIGYIGAVDNTVINIHTSIVKHKDFILQHL